ncbi:MAG: protein kinase [Planctomycetota bacterium]
MGSTNDPPREPAGNPDPSRRNSLLSHFLGEGLRVAFGPTPSPARGRLAQEGVLDWLRRSAVQSPQPTLRDCVEVPESRVRSPRDSGGQRQIGPYTVIGEIARGGVGIIYQVRERNLGRDLALKVLQGRHEDNPQLLLRFIEEAQIASQLQHPGVVPIHELGEHDGLPYFTMKLVRGRTLAALLEEREGPAERRSYFVSIFQKIAETLAYVHARGVIHRDTKPANVMVGAFGEVQVMDWGFAKVLGDRPQRRRRPRTTVESSPAESHGTATDEDIRTLRTSSPAGSASDSLVGSVVGTPAYMAPEQARGLIDDLDERADVFGLGAILCEILTGEPPFLGETAAAIHANARQGDMEPVFQRIDASGADPELVRIARSCLVADPRGRLRNAGLVARELRAYSTSLETRARAAELDAAGARVRADEAHKRRRLATVTAVCVVALVLVSAGSFLFLDQQRRSHRETTATDIRTSLSRARELRDEAWAGDFSKWELALAIAHETEARALEFGDPALVDEARALADDIAEVAEQESRMHAMLDRLERTNSEAGVPEERELLRTSKLEAVEREFASAFREFGIAVEALDPVEAARQIAASGIADAIVGALDRWAAARLGGDARQAESGRELLRVAQLADSDEQRSELRRLVIERDLAAIRALAHRDAEVEAPASTLLLLAAALGSGGAGRESVSVDRAPIEWFFSRAHQRSPDDFAINFELAEYLRLCEPPRWEESLPYYATAVALRPDSVPARTGWARALSRTNRQDAAMRAFGETIRRRPESAAAYTSFGNEMLRAKRYEEALRYFERAIEVDPMAAVPRDRRASVFRGQERWEEATEAYRSLLAVAPTHQWGWFWLGVCYVRWGDYREAESAYREAIRLYPDFAHAHCNLALALLELGHPHAAAVSLATGHRLGKENWKWAHDSAQWLETVREVVAMQDRLDARDLAEGQRIELALAAARLCEPSFKAQCARYFEMARETTGGSAAGADFRIAAAKAAAFAGRLPRGSDTASGADAAHWRGRAAQWLGEALADLPAPTEASAWNDLAVRLERWQAEPDLHAIRDSKFLERLPDAERRSYLLLWQDVERRLAEARRYAEEEGTEAPRGAGSNP